MPKLPYEIIDKILLKLGDMYISTELKRYFISEKICEEYHDDVEYVPSFGLFD